MSGIIGHAGNSIPAQEGAGAVCDCCSPILSFQYYGDSSASSASEQSWSGIFDCLYGDNDCDRRSFDRQQAHNGIVSEDTGTAHKEIVDRTMDDYPSSLERGLSECGRRALRPTDDNKRPAAHHHRRVPHCAKPPQVVARRNARERRRVHAVNAAFARLKRVVPSATANTRIGRGRRVSKLNTLRRALDYIGHLKKLLDYDNSGRG